MVETQHIQVAWFLVREIHTTFVDSETSVKLQSGLLCKLSTRMHAGKHILVK